MKVVSLPCVVQLVSSVMSFGCPYDLLIGRGQFWGSMALCGSFMGESETCVPLLTIAAPLPRALLFYQRS